MLNIRAMKDAVARWQTYEDRGIEPHYGWGKGGDGNSCALGDIAHYENISTWDCIDTHESDETVVGDYLGFGLVYNGHFSAITSREVCSQYGGIGIHEVFYFSYYSDMEMRWPIEEFQRLIEWEEATIKTENTNEVQYA